MRKIEAVIRPHLLDAVKNALQEVGVNVVERVAHQLPANPHNARYLATKRDRTGHLLG